MEQFYSRRFNTGRQLESFVRCNKIQQQQIVSITNTAFQKVNGETSSSGFIYFYGSTALDFDLFELIPAEQQEELNRKAVETESDQARAERLATLNEAYKYHTNPDNFSVKAPQKFHAEEANKIATKLIESQDAIYTKVICFGVSHIVPVDFKKYNGNDFLDLIVKINPLLKVETKWINIK